MQSTTAPSPNTPSRGSWSPSGKALPADRSSTSTAPRSSTARSFANYDRTGRLPDGTNTNIPYGGKFNTTLVKFDKNWQVIEGWIFPVSLLDRFADMSNSGGSWGPDGSLYLTGHDPAEVYKIRFPTAGSILEVDEIIPANIRGQGIAWDRSSPGILYGIIRATDAEEAQGITHKVVVFQSNLGQVPKPKDGRPDPDERFRP